MNGSWRRWEKAPRLLPLRGAFIGALGGAVYWFGAQIWPASVAVVLSMLATALLAPRARGAADAEASPGTGVGLGLGLGLAGIVFMLLIKYSALMALSAASLPFALPANLALGVIMIAGHASSRALVVSVLALPAPAGSKPASFGDLGIALCWGFAPAALLGMPGLIGLAAAIVARIALIASIRRRRPPLSPASVLDLTQELTEVSFYLGALAAWAYV